jgi:TRAP-type mannitol/chloroaromatic compound transport system substrate-binding protein
VQPDEEAEFKEEPMLRNFLFAALGTLALAAPAAAQDETVTLQLQSGYPGTLGLLGPVTKQLSETVDLVSGGTIKIRTFEPGAIVPVLEMPDAVSQGSLDAAFGGSTWWAGKEPALNFYTAVPFGPNAAEYLAWIYYGGGQEIADELFAKYNTKVLFCHLIPPEPAGWFKEELNSLEDFQGLRMRIAGYGANVLEKLGGSPQLVAPGDIYQALERGVIDGSEFSLPSLDLGIGLDQVAKHYYFPGWHQQHGFNTLWINMAKWEEMSDRQRRIIEMACNEMITRSLAESESLQAAAIEELKSRGVTVHRFSPEILDGLRAKWEEVAEEQAAADPSFKKVWDSLSAFREQYKTWSDLAAVE